MKIFTFLLSFLFSYTSFSKEGLSPDQVNQEVIKLYKKINQKNISTFAQELMKKKKNLDEQEEEIKRQSTLLKKNEDDLNKKILEFEKRQKKLIGCVDENEKKRLSRVNHLVEIVSNMKPAKSAELLSVQEGDLSVEIISRLPAAKVSKIFNLMEKEVSARLQKSYMNMKK